MTEHDGVLDLFSAAPAQEEAPAPGEAAPSTEAEVPPVETATPVEAAPHAPEPEEPTVLRVAELNRLVREHLEGNFSGIWVGGEVSNWKRAGSGHCYFSLRDDAAEVRCVLWRSDAARLPMDPDDGMEVRLFGDLTLYEARGAFQMRVRKLEAAGEDGLWRLAFERLRARLDEEGLLAPERKRPIPRYPRTVGVVTSTSGAALRDILSVLGRRAPWTRVLVRNARVQGEGAAREIADGIRFFGMTGGVDVLIVGRGGGSVEDLWAFNEEVVARAVAACPIPVVSAVGHEVDVTISDLVADLRAPTPSAAAEAVVPEADVLREQLGRVQGRLRRALQAAVDVRRRRLADGPRRLARALQSRTRPLEEQVGGTLRRLDRAIRGVLVARGRRAAVRDRLVRALEVRIAARRGRLQGLAGRLRALSPLATLERGYAIPLTEDGHLLRGTADFVPGRDFRLRVRDGRVDARVLDTTPEPSAPGTADAAAPLQPRGPAATADDADSDASPDPSHLSHEDDA